jgi:hypothetical protein
LTRYIFEIEEKSVLFAVQSSSTTEKPQRREKKIREKKTTFGWLFSGISSWDEKGRLRGEEKE